jgi:hypothetical protein
MKTIHKQRIEIAEHYASDAVTSIGEVPPWLLVAMSWAHYQGQVVGEARVIAMLRGASGYEDAYFERVDRYPDRQDWADWLENRLKEGSDG